MHIIGIFALLGALLAPGEVIADPASTAPPSGGSPVAFLAHAASTDDTFAETAAVAERSVVFTTSRTVRVTAYSSTKDQTDDSPFTMANGERVHDGAIAANFLPFGTKVMFPELFGDKIFVVKDRMHKRFTNTVDVWMETRGEALRFGTTAARMEIIADAPNRS